MSTIFTRHRAIVGTLLLTATAAVGTAWADATSATRVVSIEVEYTDINLATEAGAESLYQRIVRAARTACGPTDSRSSRVMSDYRGCLKQAIDGAVAEVNSPKLSAVHEHRSPRQASG